MKLVRDLLSKLHSCKDFTKQLYLLPTDQLLLFVVPLKQVRVSVSKRKDKRGLKRIRTSSLPSSMNNKSLRYNVGVGIKGGGTLSCRDLKARKLPMGDMRVSSAFHRSRPETFFQLSRRRLTAAMFIATTIPITPW